MALLLTVRDLAVWILPEEIPEGDQFAKLVVEVASEKVCSTARHPEWTASGANAAPLRARHIAAALAARSYKNRDSVIAEGGVGPLGGDRTVEDLARFMHLTDVETAELEGMRSSGSGSTGSLWIQPFDVYGSNALESGDIYVADDSGSDWEIPLLAGSDVPPPEGA